MTHWIKISEFKYEMRKVRFLTTIGGGANSSFPMTELSSSKLGVAAPLARTGLISTLILRLDSSSEKKRVWFKLFQGYSDMTNPNYNFIAIQKYLFHLE